MDMDWLWQGLITNWLYWLLAVGVGFLFTYLKRKGWSWTAPLLYGLMATAAAAIILSGIARSPGREAVIRGWLDGLNVSTRQMSASEASDSLWGLLITFANGHQVEVRRRKDLDRYIILQANVIVSSDDLAIWNRLGPAVDTQIVNRFSFEMAKSKLLFALNLPSFISVLKRIPINGLTEGVFLQNVDEMDDALLVAQQAFRQELDAAQTSVANHPSNK